MNEDNNHPMDNTHPEDKRNGDQDGGNQFSYFSRPITNRYPTRTVDLATVHELITSPTFKYATERLRQLPPRSPQCADYKSSSFDYVTFSGVFSHRQKNGLVSHSGLLTLDFDDIPDPAELKHQLSTDPFFPNGLIYISPSGQGLKWITPIDTKECSHENWLDALGNYIFSTYGYEIDRTGRDVSRASFLCHDPDAILTTGLPAKEFDPCDWLPKPHEHVYVLRSQDTEKYEEVEDLVRTIEESRIDLTPTYKNWITVGFALCSEFHEAGRSLFHRLSGFYPGYDYSACDKQYTYLLNAGGKGITINSLFYLALKAGVSLWPSHAITGPTGTTVLTDITCMAVTAMATAIYGLTGCTGLISLSSLTQKGNERYNTPTFDPSIFNFLPGILAELDTMDLRERERDICLLGSLGVMSACLPNIKALYDNDEIHANLYFFIVAPASAGKGKLKLCRNLGNKIHEERRNDTSFNQKKGKRLLFIPANNSAAGLLTLLNVNAKEGCIIFETEGDTLSSAFDNKEWGDYSDSFRKAFHQEEISSYRKTEDELQEIINALLACVLSGTPNQVIRLIPTVEDGLMSRFAYYLFGIDFEWRVSLKANSEDNPMTRFKKMGEKFYRQYNSMRKLSEVRFSLTDNQIMLFHEYFANKKLDSVILLGPDIIASIHRMGIIFFKIAMILTFEREASMNHYPTHLVCSDLDFKITSKIVDVLITHTEKVLAMIPTNKTIHLRKTRKDIFLERLPQDFGRQQYLEAAKLLGIPDRTAEDYVLDLAKEGKLLVVERNHYRKP
ncbi:MAG: DUF3987 domain-containing protein [Bacteroidales bacterium]|nr:DUF3987 domain-containing protein [Lentimicrobiaceae bacterium]MDD5695237.1 DUF3987 domain-containing protein [Bacteroidales bacterium]